MKRTGDNACTRDNYVRVSEKGQKWTPHCFYSYNRFKGCSISSSGRNVTLKISVGDPPAISIDIRFFAMRQTLEVVHLSSTHGYIIPPGFDAGIYYLNYVDAWLQIHLPSNHVTFLSMRKLELDVCCDKVELYADSVTENERLWDVGGFVPPLPVLVNATEMHVHFKTDRYGEHLGFKLLFSYHLRRPARVSGNLWNCSGSDWVEFQRHFLCNLVKECDGGEDEDPCHYTGDCGEGHLTLAGRCYAYFRETERTGKSWRDSDLHCQRRGGYIVSLNTPAEWRAVTELLSELTPAFHVFLGLHPTTTVLPRMYFASFMWADRTVAYFINVTDIKPNMCWYACRTSERVSFEWTRCDAEETFDVMCEFDSPLLSARLGNEAEKGSGYSPLPLSVPVNVSLPVPSVRCPSGHLSQVFLACDPRSSCWLGRRGYRDSEAAWVVPSRAACAAPSLTSLPAMFACGSRAAGSERVPYSLVCDHRGQCADGADESFCVFPACSGSTPLRCAVSAQCIAVSDLCNGQGDCPRDTDEARCDYDFASHLLTLPPPAVVFFTPVTSETKYQGPFVTKPLPPSRPRSDDPCPETHFQCPANGYCLPVFVWCNGVSDCPGGAEDEAGCDSAACPGFYRCRSAGVCLHSSHVCDGVYHCPEQDDERFCRLSCPAGCACHGLAFTCRRLFRADRHSQIRYLDAGGSGLSPALVGANAFLIYLRLSRCELTSLDSNMTFPNLRDLDLSENDLSEVSAEHFRGLRNLRFLSLSGNPLRSLFPSRRSGGGEEESRFPALRTLDVSGVKMRRLSTRVFFRFPGLETLNLSHCGVDVVAGGILRWAKDLRVLDAVGCPMTRFPRDLLSGLRRLQTVRAGNFKLCCRDALPAGFNPANCRADFDEISSCESLLRSDVYRFVISLLSGLCLAGNLACFLVRSVLSKSRGSGFGAFVTHLSASDFLMGVYLAVIGVADRVYAGSYLWRDASWKGSAACAAAGFLSLTSNEASAFLVCLITLDRFLALRFPFSRLRFTARSAHAACALIWAAALALAAVPLTPAASRWSFYGQTGICVPLPVNRGDFAGRPYAFGLLVALNFVLFVLIAAGQASVYAAVRAGSLSPGELSTKRSTDLRIARRLLTVAVSDFLCWFPVGLLGLLAARGVPVAGEVNVGIAVLVLPLNAAVNPFLYTINVVLERRRKSRDERILKELLARACEEEQMPQ